MGHEHATARRTAPLAERLRARGLRLTAQRAARARGGDRAGARHPGVDRRPAARGGRPRRRRADTSTVYRNLELLERLGLVWHTHLGKGAPVYHAAEHPHLHVVCSSCGEVVVGRPGPARRRRGTSGGRTGFTVDVGHVALSGTCRACRERAIGDPHDRSPLLVAPRRRRSRRAASVAAHYGDPLREQRLLAEGAGLVDRSDRDVLAVPGADRLRWLHSLTSQHLDRLRRRHRHRGAGALAERARRAPPRARRPRRHHLGRRRARHRRGAAGFLEKMRFLLRVEPALVTDDWAVLSPRRARRRPRSWRAAGLPGPRAAPYEVARWTRGFVRRMPPIGDGGATVFDLLVPRADLGAVADRLIAAGAAPAGVQAYEALRVEARRPRLGVDSDHRTIPNELSWLRTAVHLDKGCYRGQETVARVHNLGRPPRRLVLLHLDGVSEVLPDARHAGARRRPRVGRVGTVSATTSSARRAGPGQAVRRRGRGPDGRRVDGRDRPRRRRRGADDTRAAARERVRAVRSATIGR